MEDIIRAAHTLQKFCSDRDWSFCFIGGVALQHWGRPRLTRDVDLCLLTGFGSEESFVDELLKNYASRVDGAREFALANRVLLLMTPDEIGIDVSLGGIPYEQQVVTRASDVEYLSDVHLRICSAEDLIVLKSFADRLQDWADIQNVLEIRKAELDWAYIDRQLGELCDLNESHEIVIKLHELKNKIQ